MEEPALGLLEGKVALVTGSTQGLGEGIARRFVREGARVVVNGRSREKGERVVAALRELGGEAIFLQADLCDRVAAMKLVNDASAHFVSVAYRAAEQHRLDALLVLAVMAIESRYNPVAESVMGAKGLMQVIPKYHQEKLFQHGGDHVTEDEKRH